MTFEIRTLVLPSQLRKALKSPIGKLITGSPERTMRELAKLINKERPPKIISVGDTVSKNMTNYGISTHLAIVDNRALRQPREPIMLEAAETIRVENPPGMITKEAWLALRQALKQKRLVKIVVDGEEDLLTLIVLLHAPSNTLVVYGQPYKGIVVVKATQQTRQQALRIIEAMQPLRKTKVNDDVSNQQSPEVYK